MLNDTEIKYGEQYSAKSPSERYKKLLSQYIDMHDSSDKMFNGKSLYKFVYYIKNLIKRHDVKSILDYGCGKGQLYTEDYKKIASGLSAPLPKLWNLDSYHLYDPGYREHNKLPKSKQDAVICTDVLEHVPSSDMKWVVENILSYAKKIAFFNISCMPAVKKFPDGENVHVSIYNPEVWATFFCKLLKDESYKDLTIYVHADYRLDDNCIANRLFQIRYYPTIFEIKEI